MYWYTLFDSHFFCGWGCSFFARQNTVYISEKRHEGKKRTWIWTFCQSPLFSGESLTLQATQSPLFLAKSYTQGSRDNDTRQKNDQPSANEFWSFWGGGRSNCCHRSAGAFSEQFFSMQTGGMGIHTLSWRTWWLRVARHKGHSPIPTVL